ncbi:MAG: GNAT family N-acetyltransferase [Candidatus Omnitrophica bacterium]|nr:GNAT family N-acetyltransferase [Candidatus Omnitrophota bacterium]
MKTVKTLPLFKALQALELPGLDENLFFSSAWFRVVESAYHPKMFLKYIEKNGKVASYVVYTAVRNFLEWKICILSYCDYCDAHVETEEDWKIFFDSFRKDFPEYRIAIRSLRDKKVASCGTFHELSRERFHYWDIRQDVETLWKNLDGSFRNQIRQGERRGLVCREGTLKDLWSFYLLHVNLRKEKYRIFAQPYRFFKAIWDEYIAKGNGFLLCAFTPEGKMVGGTLFLICGNTLYYKINTSSRDALEYRSNNVLVWEGLKRAKARGLSYFDLGSSGLEQHGLVHFKDSTGAQRFDIVHLGYHPEGYLFSQKRILKAYTRFMTQAWIPTLITRMGSHLIYPFLA